MPDPDAARGAIMSESYAAFSAREHHQRLARARAALAGAGIDVCVSVAPETHYYLAGYDTWVGVNSPQALIFGVHDDRDPVLLVRNVDTPLARETSWLGDIRAYRLFTDDFAAMVGDLVRAAAGGEPRIATELQSYALSAALYRQLAAALPGNLVDATTLLGDLRSVKSPAELSLLREAASYTRRGLDAARECLRPGVTEIELAAAVEAAMRAAGSDYWSIPTELASGPRTPGGHATPRQRVIRDGELVHLEFAGVASRYHAVAVHTLACGEPDARAREVYELARASLAAGIAACAPGRCVAEIEEASLEPLRTAGLAKHANMRFGYGVGLAYPPVWLETLQISRGFDTCLSPGMTFVLHAYLQLDEEGLGVIQGGTWALTETGLEQLCGGGDVPLEVC